MAVAVAVMVTIAVASCPPAAATEGAGVAFYARHFSKHPKPDLLAAVGRAIFFAPALSASGRQSCASCHDPAHAYGPPDDRPVEPGGAGLDRAGLRAVPSLRYLAKVPPFTEHYHEAEGDDSVDQGPAGGYTWDGRARNVHEQAALPLLSADEMANDSVAACVARARRSALTPLLKDAFGDDVLDDDARAFAAITWALEVFQQVPAEFYPYSSKYDAVLRHRARLTPEEQRGLDLFSDPRKGNCAACHPSAIRDGGLPQFTDFGFVAVGVPRNAAIPANADPGYADLGLCGPQRTDLADHPEYCGRFRTPTLRNVAQRRVFFHNGAFRDLRRVVDFYARRDLDPAAWYPRRGDGTIDVYDDLPPRYRANVNREPPFDRAPGDRPALSPAEIDAIVAFLRTLSDGWIEPSR